jgi:hypothetical protein
VEITIVMRRTQVPGVEGIGVYSDTVYHQEIRDDVMIKGIVIGIDSLEWAEPYTANLEINRGRDVRDVPLRQEQLPIAEPVILVNAPDNPFTKYPEDGDYDDS